MYPGEFETLFRKVANIFTLETVAERRRLKGNFPRRNPETPLWDTMDCGLEHDYIAIGKGRYVSCTKLFRKPIRILFFMILVELEGRLFRIHEWQGKDIAELNEKNFNDLIRELVHSDLLAFQDEYPSRSKFNEDFKAVSSFRNVIMHVNKKLERAVPLETLLKRRAQVMKLLAALQQIMDRMKPFKTKLK